MGGIEGMVGRTFRGGRHPASWKTQEAQRGSPDNSDPNQLSRILVSLLRTRVVELQGNPGGRVPLQTVIDTAATRRKGASPPTLDEIRAAIVASENRLDLQTTGDSGEYLIRAGMGHTGGTSLACLGQALASHEPWVLHATFLERVPAIWNQGLTPHGAPVRRGHSPRQDLYLGLGSDPRAGFPNSPTLGPTRAASLRRAGTSCSGSTGEG